MTALFEKIGPAILVTHSHSGGMGWRVASRTRNVRAIVSYEPGSGFIFPQGEVPAAIPMAGGAMTAVGVPLPEFLPLTKIPIVIYYGDNIPANRWRTRVRTGGARAWSMARLWRDAVNRHGGDVTVVHLPRSASAATRTSRSRT